MKTALVVRFRGIGDVLLSWFGIENLRRLYKVVYVTSPVCAKLFPKGFVDKIIAYDWKDHPLEPMPKLPDEILAIPHDKIVNLVNAVDWIDEQYLKSDRASLMAKLMGVEPSTYVREIISRPEPYEQPTIAMQLDSRGKTRRWRIKNWITLSELLVKNGYKVRWYSIDENHRKMPRIDGITNRSCDTSIMEYLKEIARCIATVSVCSAMIHIAGRMPWLTSFGLYGSTDYKLLAPFYTNVVPIANYSLKCSPCADWQLSAACYKQKHAPWCLSMISPYLVYYEMAKILETKTVSLARNNNEPLPIVKKSYLPMW